MKIGLISDTHIPEAMPELPGQVRTVFSGVDLILHAGDLHCLDVLNWLEEIAPVLACRGNGDDGSGGRAVVPEDPRLRDAAVTTGAGFKLGLVHDVLDPHEFPQWPVERTMTKSSRVSWCTEISPRTTSVNVITPESGVRNRIETPSPPATSRSRQ